MRPTIVCLACFLLQACTGTGSVWSYCTEPPPPAVIEGGVLRLLTLNASHGRKTSWNQMMVSKDKTYENLDRIADLLERTDADVIALQEADAPSRWSGQFGHVDYLRNRIGYGCSLHGEHAESWLFSYGTALLAKSRMRNGTSVTFPPSPPTTTKGYVRMTIDWQHPSGVVSVTVVSVHLDFSRISVRDEQIAVLVSDLRAIETPLIVMGDLNSQWDQEPSHVRRLADELGLIAFEPTLANLGTYKDASGKRLDWILASSALEFRRYEVLPDVVSDHRAVYSEIGYTQ
jgi:endonuclease/exonuclease/phosphatase family metal-dependent hydrolase